MPVVNTPDTEETTSEFQTQNNFDQNPTNEIEKNYITKQLLTSSDFKPIQVLEYDAQADLQARIWNLFKRRNSKKNGIKFPRNLIDTHEMILAPD